MRRNSCHNRQPFADSLLVQVGWADSGPTRFPVMREIPFRMSRECVYSADRSPVAEMGRIGAFDPGCEGCRWKQEAGR